MFFNRRFQKGFTILELLVVVAIIGILTAVVFGALNNARAKGADKAIISNLASVRSQADLYYGANTNSYGTFNGNNVSGAAGNCPSISFAPAITGQYQHSVFRDTLTGGMTFSVVATNAITEANKQSGGSESGTQRLTNTRCATNGATWAVAVNLKTNSGRSWCVDSNGSAKEVAAAAGASNAVFDTTTSGVVKCS